MVITNMDVYKAKCKFSRENVVIKRIENFTAKPTELKDCVLSQLDKTYKLQSLQGSHKNLT